MSASSKQLIHKALLLEYFTVGYNILEATASLIAGFLASSIALTGFGLDSVVESLSGFVLIWRLKKSGGRDKTQRKKRSVSWTQRSGFSARTCSWNPSERSSGGKFQILLRLES